MNPMVECSKCAKTTDHILFWYETTEGIPLLYTKCASCGQLNSTVNPKPGLLPIMPEHPVVTSLGLKKVEGSDWKHMPFVAFDTETTGVGTDARIVDIGWLYVIAGTENGLESRLCKPNPEPNWEDPEVKKALDVNQIKVEDLANCPSFESVFDHFLHACRYPIWCGHNVIFDLRMIKQERFIIEEQQGVDYTVSIPRPLFIADTMLLDIALRPREKKRKLAVVAERWGVEPDGVAHRALADAKTSARIFCKMIPELPGDMVELEAMQAKARAKWTEICEWAAKKRAEAPAQ